MNCDKESNDLQLTKHYKNEPESLNKSAQLLARDENLLDRSTIDLTYVPQEHFRRMAGLSQQRRLWQEQPQRAMMEKQVTFGLKNPVFKVHQDVLSHHEIKNRILYIKKVCPTINVDRIMRKLKANDFHIKRTIEVLVDQLTLEASHLQTSQLLYSKSQLFLHQSQYMHAGAPNAFNARMMHPVKPMEYNRKPIEHITAFPNRTMEASGKRKALLIGINYFGTRKELNGCCDDIMRVKKLISGVYGFIDNPATMTVLCDKPGWDTRLLPSRDNCLLAMRWLVKDAKPGDVLFFQFSGHGGQKKDLSGTEIDGFDETIMPLDYKSAGHITDDLIHNTMIRDLPSGVKLVCVMDCCHSGSGMDLPYYLVGSKWREEPYPKHSEGDVLLISSCQDNETAADFMIPSWGSGGAVTMALVIALAQNPFGLTCHDLFKNIKVFLSRRKFGQCPQLSASQRFDVTTTLFNMTDIIPNGNTHIENRRVKKKPH